MEDILNKWTFFIKMDISQTSLETIKLEYKSFPEDQSNYRLNEISKIKDCFNEEIQYQQSLTNKLSKYLTILDYVNKILIVFLAVFSSTNIISHVKGKKKLVGLITSIFFSLFWNSCNKIKTRNKVKKGKT